MRKLALPSIHTGDLILVNRNVPVVGEPEELTDLGNGVLLAQPAAHTWRHCWKPSTLALPSPR